MKLGAFSISLSVKDLEVSKAFYVKLGFKVFVDQSEKNYLIMKSGDTLVGLFHGMFTGNIMTFNPGWDQSAQSVEDFDDVRKIQNHLLANDIPIDNPLDENSTGPGSIMIADPDGNVILLDQHV